MNNNSIVKDLEKHRDIKETKLPIAEIKKNINYFLIVNYVCIFLVSLSWILFISCLIFRQSLPTVLMGNEMVRQKSNIVDGLFYSSISFWIFSIFVTGILTTILSKKIHEQYKKTFFEEIIILGFLNTIFSIIYVFSIVSFVILIKHQKKLSNN